MTQQTIKKENLWVKLVEISKILNKPWVVLVDFNKVQIREEIICLHARTWTKIYTYTIMLLMTPKQYIRVV